LAKQDRIRLRALCIELAGPEAMDLRSFATDAAHIIFDVCDAFAIEPVVVMDARTVYGIRAEKVCRLWPTLSEAEDEEMIDLANLREPDIEDKDAPISPQDIEAMYSPRWRVAGIRNA
jgi:hypothetical protein